MLEMNSVISTANEIVLPFCDIALSFLALSVIRRLFAARIR